MRIKAAMQAQNPKTAPLIAHEPTREPSKKTRWTTNHRVGLCQGKGFRGESVRTA
jgi:hypothetical protein